MIDPAEYAAERVRTLEAENTELARQNARMIEMMRAAEIRIDQLMADRDQQTTTIDEMQTMIDSLLAELEKLRTQKPPTTH